MQSDELVRGMLYLSLTVVGVPGNMAVIWAFLLALYQERCILPVDVIVLHLACANLLVVGVLCLLETLASFRLTNAFWHKGCRGVIYIYWMLRSLWLTFALSTYQCPSIAPPLSAPWQPATWGLSSSVSGSSTPAWALRPSCVWVCTLTVRKTMGTSLISDLRIFFSSLYAALSPLAIIGSNRKVNGRLRCVVAEKPIQEKATNVSTL